MATLGVTAREPMTTGGLGGFGERTDAPHRSCAGLPIQEPSITRSSVKGAKSADNGANRFAEGAAGLPLRFAEMTQPPDALFKPQVRLCCEVGDAMFTTFREQFSKASELPDPLVVELTTLGGDADIGRRIAADIRLFREHAGRNPLFFGKTTVYSAGATIMAAFRREDRWMDRHAVLMVHCRKLAKSVEFDSFLKHERDVAEALLAEIDVGIRVETWGFEELIAGSDVSLEELEEKARQNWYLTAEEALERGLIAGVI
jgi:ATP-dependent protease ClpP protease subunit